jgi:FMN phosphatase YigB (HAD superfamily)
VLELALARLGLPAPSVMHAGFGWKYDLGPARALGMAACFVNRGQISVDAPRDVEVASLEALAELMGV